MYIEMNRKDKTVQIEMKDQPLGAIDTFGEEIESTMRTP